MQGFYLMASWWAAELPLSCCFLRMIALRSLRTVSMFTKHSFVYIYVLCLEGRTIECRLAEPSHKHFRLDAVKIKRAQRMLRARYRTEAIDRALDLVISNTKGTVGR